MMIMNTHQCAPAASFGGVKTGSVDAMLELDMVADVAAEEDEQPAKTTWKLIEEQVFQGNLEYANGRYIGVIPIERDPDTRNAVVTSGQMDRNVVKFHRENFASQKDREERQEILALEVNTILWEWEEARTQQRGEYMNLPPVVCIALKELKPTFLVYRGACTYFAALKMSKAYGFKPINVPIEIYVISQPDEIKIITDRIRSQHDNDVLFSCLV